MALIIFWIWLCFASWNGKQRFLMNPGTGQILLYNDVAAHRQVWPVVLGFPFLSVEYGLRWPWAFSRIVWSQNPTKAKDATLYSSGSLKWRWRNLVLHFPLPTGNHWLVLFICESVSHVHLLVFFFRLHTYVISYSVCLSLIFHLAYCCQWQNWPSFLWPIFHCGLPRRC